MPYRRRRVVRRPMRKTRSRRRSKTGLSRSNVGMRVHTAKQAPLGQFFKMKLPYYENALSVTPPLGGVGTYQFTANGLYDPNVSGTGHQPLGFDQVMPMYDHYTVIGAKITVNFVNLDTTYPQIVGIRLSDSLTTSNDIEQIVENGNCVYTTIPRVGESPSNLTLIYKVGLKKFFKQKLLDDKYSGTVGANPSDQAFFQIFCCNTNPSFNSNGVRFQVRIDYIALFREPKLLGKS